MNFLVVGLGGGLGAMLRYAISLLSWKGDFPVLTLVTNFLGAVVIGFIAGAAVRRNLSPNMVLFLKTGFCGGFTTFSTFSLESYMLFQNGNYTYGGLYMVASVVLCLGGIVIGMQLAQ